MAQRRLLREIEATKTNAEVEAYYQAHINNQYNPISFNCEHFAYECATGQKKSPTVKGYMIGANYTFAKNIVGAIEWYDLESKGVEGEDLYVPKQDMETLWAQVVFTF